MKYYLDEDLDPALAGAARALGLDVVSAHEVGARGLSDAEQLARAAAAGRCLVTFNRADFIALTRRAYEGGQPHAGLLLIPPQLRYSRPGALATALAAHAARLGTPGLPSYSIAFLSPPVLR
jgi:hypothetical protein